MTRKMAVCNVSMGGGKAVLAVPSLPTGEARVELLHRYGDFIGSLNGLYATAPDVNTSERDMDTIGERTEHVFCKSVANGGSGSTAPATAVGVFHGIRASVRHALGSDLAGVRVLVQGFGAVGSLLAQQLAAAGAEVRVSDIDPARIDRLRDRRPGRRHRHRVRRLRAVRDGRDDHRHDGRGAPLPRRRRRGQQPARRPRARRPPARARHPLRARLRDQLRRRPARHRPRAARLGPRAARRRAARPRRHAARALTPTVAARPVHAAEALVARRRAA